MLQADQRLVAIGQLGTVGEFRRQRTDREFDARNVLGVKHACARQIEAGIDYRVHDEAAGIGFVSER